MIDKYLFRCMMILLFMTGGALYPILFGAVIANVLIFLFTLILFLKKNIYLKSSLTTFLCYLGILSFVILSHFAITGFNNQDNEFFKLFIRLICSCFMLLVYSIYNRPLIDDLIWVFNIIIVHSFINFVLGFFMSSQMDLIVSDQIIVKTIKYLFFYNSEASILNINFYRNQGIFWEPGVLSVYLNLALFIQIFLKQSSKVIPFYLFLIVSTFSSTGLVVSLIQILVFYKNLILKNVRLLFVLVALCVILIPIIIGNMNDKILGDGSASFLLRLYDFMISGQIIMSNFFTGIGFGNQLYKAEQIKYSLFGDLEVDDGSGAGGRGNTNSIMYIFAAFGVPLGLYILKSIYNQTVVLTNQKLLFFVVILLCLASEPLITSGIFLLIIFSNRFYYMNSDLNIVKQNR